MKVMVAMKVATRARGAVESGVQMRASPFNALLGTIFH